MRRDAKHTEGLIWDNKIEECQLCGLHGSRDGTNGILNGGRNTRIVRVEDIARDPQIGTSDEMVNEDIKRKEVRFACLPVSMLTEKGVSPSVILVKYCKFWISSSPEICPRLFR
jgi:hypothetical protein